MPERPHLYPDLTVAESIRFHAAFHQRFDHAAADRLIARFGLPSDRVLSRLSKGEMGKLMILQALAQRPDLLVLDEPTDGLDPVVRREALSAILEYVSETGASVLISSHLVHELERFCDWIGVLDQGTMVAELPMQEFKSGLKRLRVGAGAAVASAPFSVLAREVGGRGRRAVDRARMAAGNVGVVPRGPSRSAKWWISTSRKRSSSCCAPHALPMGG